MRLNINTIVTKLRDFIINNPLLIVFFIISIGLRLYNFEPHLTFLGDQGRDAIIVKRIITFEHLPLVGPPTSIGQVFLGPFYYYLIAPFLLLWNFNPVGLGYGVLILSCIGILLSYLAVSKTMGKLVASLFLAFIASSSVNISFARFSWNPNLLPVFIFITLYFFYKMITKLHTRDAFVFGLFFALSLQLHYVTIMLALPFTVLLLVGYLKNTRRFKQLATNLLVSIASFGLFFSPLIIFDLRHDFINTKTFLKMFSQTDVVSSPHASLLARFIDTHYQFVNHVLAVNVPFFIAFILIIGLFLWGLAYVIRSKNIFFAVQFVSLYGFLFAFSFLNSQRYEHYYGPAYFSLYIVIATLLSSLCTKKKTKTMFRLLAIFVVAVYAACNFSGFRYVFVEGSKRLEHAQRVAKTIIPEITAMPFQMVALPYTESDSMYRYFVELSGKTPLSESTIANPQELFVLCFKPPCNVLNDAQWQIAAFQQKKIDKMWTVDNITIYKVIHKK